MFQHQVFHVQRPGARRGKPIAVERRRWQDKLSQQLRMPSFGEADIVTDAYSVGRIRVSALYAGSAIYPRLCLRVTVGLRDLPGRAIDEETPSQCEIIELTGELRLAENAEVIGSLTWTGERRAVRSSPAAFETDVVCCCDLDVPRLELVERRRNGAAPTFYAEFWPILLVGQRRISARVHGFALHVPREAWLDFLRLAGGSEFEVLEIQYGPSERDYFRRGLEHVRAARLKLVAGEYDEAVALCRKVIEAAGHELSPEESGAALRQLFVRATGEKRGTEYAGIVSKLKQLGAFAHHDFGGPTTYSRAEAQFVIRVTESILSLASHLAAAIPHSPAG